MLVEASTQDKTATTIPKLAKSKAIRKDPKPKIAPAKSEMKAKTATPKLPATRSTVTTKTKRDARATKSKPRGNRGTPEFGNKNREVKIEDDQARESAKESEQEDDQSVNMRVKTKQPVNTNRHQNQTSESD